MYLVSQLHWINYARGLQVSVPVCLMRLLWKELEWKYTFFTNLGKLFSSFFALGYDSMFYLLEKYYNMSSLWKMVVKRKP